MTVGQLAKQTGFSIDTIRYYEKMGLLSPAYYTRRDNGYKDYHADAAEVLRMIQLAKLYGFSLTDVKRYLACQGDTSLNCSLLLPLLRRRLADIDEHLAALAAQRARLERDLALLEGQC